MLIDWLDATMGETVRAAVEGAVGLLGPLLALPLRFIVWAGQIGQVAAWLVLLAAIIALITFYFGSFVGLMAVGPAALWRSLQLAWMLKAFGGFWLNWQIRRNHALEHATINVLFEQGRIRHPAIMGLSFPEGFWITWNEPADEGEDLARVYLQAAVEGAKRLRAGEHHLAFSVLCGTAHIMMAFLLFLGFWALVWYTRGDVYDVVLGLEIMALAAPILGWEMQRLTLTPRIGETQPLAAEVHEESGHVFIRTDPYARRPTLPPFPSSWEIREGGLWAPLRPGDPIPRWWWDIPRVWWHRMRKRRQAIETARRQREQLRREQPERFWGENGDGERRDRVVTVADLEAARPARGSEPGRLDGDRRVRDHRAADRRDGGTEWRRQPRDRAAGRRRHLGFRRRADGSSRD